jgi:hypothetical protein
VPCVYSGLSFYAFFRALSARYKVPMWIVSPLSRAFSAQAAPSWHIDRKVSRANEGVE